MTDLRTLTAEAEQLKEDVGYLMALLETAPHGCVPPLLTPPLAALATTSRPLPVGSSRSTRARVWHVLTTSEAARAWGELSAWVAWLVVRYQLDDTLPTCWYRHNAMVDELDALRSAWIGAYVDPTAHPGDAARWMELLAKGTARIHAWDRFGCAGGTHRSDVTPASDDDPELRLQYLQTDVERRDRTRRTAVASAGNGGGLPGDLVLASPVAPGPAPRRNT